MVIPGCEAYVTHVLGGGKDIGQPGDEPRVSASDMPDARYSSTSYTVMRSPRMHGLPPRFPGSIVTIAR
jgi:hypothetical protein